jgi:hypothetical protein
MRASTLKPIISGIYTVSAYNATIFHDFDCEISRKVDIVRNIVDIDGEA